MVLSGLGFDISEAELRSRCDCTIFGTHALKAVDAVRQLGFVKTAKHTLSVAELETLTANKRFPIVFIDLHPVEGIHQPHSLVVINVSDSDVWVYDPAKGELPLPLQTFIVAWAMRHNLAIIVEA